MAQLSFGNRAWTTIDRQPRASRCAEASFTDLSDRKTPQTRLTGFWLYHPIRRFSAESFPRLFTTSKLTLAPSASEV